MAVTLPFASGPIQVGFIETSPEASHLFFLLLLLRQLLFLLLFDSVYIFIHTHIVPFLHYHLYIHHASYKQHMIACRIRV